MDVRPYVTALAPGEIRILTNARDLPFMGDVPDHAVDDLSSLIAKGMLEDCYGVFVVTACGLNWLRLVEAS